MIGKERIVFIDWVPICNPKKIINGGGEPTNLQFISVHICTNIEGILEIEDISFYKVPYKTPTVVATANDSLFILTEISHWTRTRMITNSIKLLKEALELVFSNGIFYFKGELHRVIHDQSLEKAVFKGSTYAVIREPV